MAGAGGRAPYRADINGLRAVAVLAVIANHISERWLPSGYLGVDIFFVISGCVISASLARLPGETAGEFVINFYTRRIKRLIPALVLCVLISALAISLVDPDPRLSIRTGAASLFGLSNLYLFRQATDYFAPSSQLNVFTHTWSLGVEEQFYLVFPILYWMAMRGALHRWRVTALVLAPLAVASLAAFVLLYKAHQPMAYFTMPTRFWELAVGCAIGYTLPQTGRLASASPSGLGRVADVAAAVIGVGLLGSLFLPARLGALATICVVAQTGLLIALIRPGTPAYTLLTRPFVVRLGLISYSLYLWHWSVLSLSRWTIGIHWWSLPLQLAAMVLAAELSYRYVEQPLRHAQWSANRVRSIAYGLGISAAAAAFVTAIGRLHLYTGNTPVTPAPIAYRGPYTSRIARQCHSSDAAVYDALQGATVVTPEFARHCLFEGDPTKPLVAFVGDSHTLSMFPLQELLAQKQRLSVFSHSRDGCAFPAQGSTTRRGCLEAMTNTESWVLGQFRERGGGVLVATSFLQSYFGYEGAHRLQFRTHPAGTKHDVDANLRDYAAALAALAQRLAAVHASLVVVAPGPEHPGYAPETCTPQWFKPAWSLPSTCSYSERAPLIQNDAPVRRALYEVARANANVFVYDPFSILCQSDSRCFVSHAGQSLYADDNHLNVNGATFLYDDFMKFLWRNNIVARSTSVTAERDRGHAG